MLYDDLVSIINDYLESFNKKEIIDIGEDTDLLMDLYGLTADIIKTNKQYWNRELGALFELISTKIFEQLSEYKPKEKIGNDAPYDFIFKNYAIDTKYRIGSGDAGTLKKFKQYGAQLTGMGYKPVILLFRTDNLKAAITACKKGGWTIYQGEDCFKFIKEHSEFDLKSFLRKNKGKYAVRKSI